jgi:enoyl-CoA hydratase
VVVTGEGDRFTPVGDLTPLLEKTQESNRTGDWYDRLPEHRVPRFVRSLLAVEQPVLAAVNGDALGWGTALASWVDVAIVAQDARFGDIHIELGLSVPQLSLSWPENVGVARAKGLLLTGAVVSGSEAAQMGLVWQAVERKTVLDTTLAIARRLAAQPALAVQWTKRVLNLGLREQAGAPMDLSMALEGLTLLSQEHLARLMARRPGLDDG